MLLHHLHHYKVVMILPLFYCKKNNNLKEIKEVETNNLETNDK